MPLQKLCPAEEFITNYLISWFSHEKEIDETMSNPLHPEHFKGPELDQSLFRKLSSIFWNWLVSANAVELNCLLKWKSTFHDYLEHPRCDSAFLMLVKRKNRESVAAFRNLQMPAQEKRDHDQGTARVCVPGGVLALQPAMPVWTPALLFILST